MPRESTIQVYRSSTAANVPTGLTAGELAANLIDRKLFVGGTNGSTITFLDASAVVTGVNGTTGNVTNVAVTNATNSFTAVQSFPNGISSAGGATFTGNNSISNLKVAFAGGDEGGQIDFDVARSNTSLTGTIAIDIYQNRLRIFETASPNRGAYIDITAAASGVGSNLLAGGSSTPPPLASASITGVASFSTNDFVVGTTGHVGLTGTIARTNATNNFTAVQSFPNGISGNNLSIAGGATFAGGTMDFTAASPTIQGYNPTGTLVMTTYGTNYSLNGSSNPRISLLSSDAGAFPTSDTATVAASVINVNAAYTMNIGSNTTNVLTINGIATFPNNSVHFAQGMSANGMIVAGRGATFTTRASFSGGVTANGLWVGGQGATFNSNATFNNTVSVLGGLTSNSLWVGGQGATFNSNTTFNNAVTALGGITANGLWVGGQGATFTTLPTFVVGLSAASLTATNGNIPQFTSTTLTGTTANISTLRCNIFNARTPSGSLIFTAGTNGGISMEGNGGGLSYQDSSGGGVYFLVTQAAGQIQFGDTVSTNLMTIVPAVQNINFGTYGLSGGTANFISGSYSKNLTVNGGMSASSYVLSANGISGVPTTTYSLTGSDNGKVMTFSNNTGAITLTVPAGLPVGYSMTAIQLGTGQVGFTAPAGVTLNSYTNLYKIAGQHGSASLVSYQTNVFNLAGNLA